MNNLLLKKIIRKTLFLTVNVPTTDKQKMGIIFYTNRLISYRIIFPLPASYSSFHTYFHSYCGQPKT